MALLEVFMNLFIRLVLLCSLFGGERFRALAG
jgi:hypothetical protein